MVQNSWLYNMAEDIIRREENVDVEGIGSRISDDIGQIIEHSKHAVAVYLNMEVTLTYWRIGRCIANELDAISDEKYGSKIVSTVSRHSYRLNRLCFGSVVLSS